MLQVYEYPRMFSNSKLREHNMEFTLLAEFKLVDSYIVEEYLYIRIYCILCIVSYNNIIYDV